ncbi:hypothetical protein ZWY2020_046473 [Hordeum vulgare]|nr:hypothetical protein ZWY2020_046473 [Hordeum vulgare]
MFALRHPSLPLSSGDPLAPPDSDWMHGDRKPEALHHRHLHGPDALLLAAGRSRQKHQPLLFSASAPWIWTVPRRWHGRPTWYVVAFNGELLLVVTYRAPNIKAVEVYRPDWAAESLELRDKVIDLGD